jgi:hypothetical protein
LPARLGGFSDCDELAAGAAPENSMYLVHDLVAKEWPLSDKNNLQSRRLKESATLLDDKTVIKLFRHAGASDKKHRGGADSEFVRRSCARLVRALRG